MASSGVARAPSRNGRVDGAEARPEERRSLLARVIGELAGQVERRIPRGDLDERDPDFIRERLPLLWLLASIWFRGEVRGLGNVPEDGPVLLVGNHSGGNLTPDTHVFTRSEERRVGKECRSRRETYHEEEYEVV